MPGVVSRGRGRRAISEINMVPFIDVMLVLLIIFMVAAPLLTSGVAVDLPQAKAGALNVEQKPIAIAIDDKGQVFLMDLPVADTEVVDKLTALAKDGADTRIYLRASKTVAYGRVAQIMAEVTGAGFKKVALVTDPDSH